MQSDSTGMALAIAGVLFLLYVLLKLRVSFAPSSPEAQAAKQRIQDAKQRARQSGLTPSERAEAWREAAIAALEGLKRPNLAASYARRAERVNPDDEAAVRVLSLSMREAGRLRALERLLWRRLAQDGHGPAHLKAYDELISLYAGPMRCPERATVLRRMRRASIPPSGLQKRSG